MSSSSLQQMQDRMAELKLDIDRSPELWDLEGQVLYLEETIQDIVGPAVLRDMDGERTCRRRSRSSSLSKDKDASYKGQLQKKKQEKSTMKAKAAADADAADEGDDNNDVEYCDDMLFIFERQMQSVQKEYVRLAEEKTDLMMAEDGPDGKTNNNHSDRLGEIAEKMKDYRALLDSHTEKIRAMEEKRTELQHRENDDYYGGDGDYSDGEETDEEGYENEKDEAEVSTLKSQLVFVQEEIRELKEKKIEFEQLQASCEAIAAL